MNSRWIYMILVLLLCSCISDEYISTKGKTFEGQISAEKNGVLWNQKFTLSGDNFQHCANSDEVFPKSIVISNIVKDSYIWEHLSINIDNPDLKKHFLKDLDFNDESEAPKVFIRYFTTVGHDANSSWYERDTTAMMDYIFLTEYDSRTKILNREFHLSFFIKRKSPHTPEDPDQIVFKDGKFSVKAPAEWFELRDCN